MAQHYSSKGTSINSTKAPRIVALMKRYNLIDSNSTVFDYGAGRFPMTTQAALDVAQYFPFDPYNLPQDVNQASVDAVFENGADVVMCSNVLNVIDDDDAVEEVIDRCLAKVKTGGHAIFTVYEGNKSGIGRKSKEDCWQRNETLSTYAARFFHQYSTAKYWSVHTTHDAIILTAKGF